MSSTTSMTITAIAGGQRTDESSEARDVMPRHKANKNGKGKVVQKRKSDSSLDDESSGLKESMDHGNGRFEQNKIASGRVLLAKPQNGEAPAKARRTRKPKDPNAPKKNVSAYIWFTYEMREKVKRGNPELTFGQIGKELGRLWTELDEESKKKFVELAKKDKSRFDREMDALTKA